jgi:phage shock protein E
MKTLLALTFLALLLVSPAARAGEPARKPSASSTVAPGIVDGATAHRLVADGVRVVDVRTPQEFQAGHVPGATNVPYDQIGARAGELGPPSAPLLLYCHSGRRSGIAVQTLKAQGFTRLYDLQAYDRWVDSEPKGK